MSRKYRLLKQIAILIAGLLSAAFGTNTIAFGEIDLISVGGEPVTFNPKFPLL
jgi:hypothetical protein